MFVINKRYDLEIEDEVDNQGYPVITTYPDRIVIEIEGALIKVALGEEEQIINTQSRAFVRATPRQ